MDLKKIHNLRNINNIIHCNLVLLPIELLTYDV